MCFFSSGRERTKAAFATKLVLNSSGRFVSETQIISRAYMLDLFRVTIKVAYSRHIFTCKFMYSARNLFFFSEKLSHSFV